MNTAVPLIFATLVFSGVCIAQQPASKGNDAKYEAAIETIATSNDVSAVRQADSILRSGGVESINVLVRHVNDERQARTNYLTRAVTGRVSMGDHCFWLIQDQLEDHSSKMDVTFSALNRINITEWLAARSEMSLAHLRREACIASFRVILDFEKRHPDYDISPTLRAYATKLVILDAAVTNAENKAVNRSTQKRGN